ncbi:MAG: helicase-associated domain-containing protein [Sphaerochaetaceae bacterium]|nr:helicase-associated domain-containing protein [Spirochaetales bacterium]MDY5498959.1 helicase-associated domain-containing protein [Sphaerochaetaceae bacterium]
MGEFVNESLVQILDGYDDASLSLLANDRVRSRSETEQLLAERARAETISLSPIECGMLTAIHLFPATSSLALIAALESWQPHQKLIAALSHLEMRLFVLVDTGRLVLNPLRESELIDHTALSTLFTPGQTLAHDGFCLDTEMLRGLLSIADQNGTLPSRCPLPACADARWKELLPELQGVLEKLAILSPSGGVDHARFEELASLGPRKALAVCLELASGVSRQLWGRFLRIMEVQESVDTTSLRIMLRLLGIKPTRGLWNMLRRWGLPASRGQRRMLLVDSDQSVTYEGYAPQGDLLWRFATLESEEQAARYLISRESLARALDGGIPIEGILQYLKANTFGYPLEQLERSIRLMGEQYQAVHLTHAIILEADERTSRLVEGLPQVRAAVLRRPAKGLYVMDGGSWTSWSHALKQALGFLPRLQGEPYVPASPKRALLSIVDWKEPEAEIRLQPKIAPDAGAQDSSLVVGSADGFEYQAKVTLIKQHLKDGPGLYLEVEAGGETLLVRPLELDKTSDGETLLRAEIQPSGEIRNLRVRTMYGLTVRHWPLF